MTSRCANNACNLPGDNCCKRCKLVCYCSTECQKQSWLKHKDICKWVGNAVKEFEFVAPSTVSELEWSVLDMQNGSGTFSAEPPEWYSHRIESFWSERVYRLNGAAVVTASVYLPAFKKLIQEGFNKKLISWEYLASDTFMEMAAHAKVPLKALLHITEHYILKPTKKPKASALLETIVNEKYWKGLSLPNQLNYEPAVAMMLYRHKINLPFPENGDHNIDELRLYTHMTLDTPCDCYHCQVRPFVEEKKEELWTNMITRHKIKQQLSGNRLIAWKEWIAYRDEVFNAYLWDIDTSIGSNTCEKWCFEPDSQDDSADLLKLTDMDELCSLLLKRDTNQKLNHNDTDILDDFAYVMSIANVTLLPPHLHQSNCDLPVLSDTERTAAMETVAAERKARAAALFVKSSSNSSGSKKPIGTINKIVMSSTIVNDGDDVAARPLWSSHNRPNATTFMNNSNNNNASKDTEAAGNKHPRTSDKPAWGSDAKSQQGQHSSKRHKHSPSSSPSKTKQQRIETEEEKTERLLREQAEVWYDHPDFVKVRPKREAVAKITTLDQNALLKPSAQLAKEANRLSNDRVDAGSSGDVKSKDGVVWTDEMLYRLRKYHNAYGTSDWNKIANSINTYFAEHGHSQHSHHHTSNSNNNNNNSSNHSNSYSDAVKVNAFQCVSKWNEIKDKAAVRVNNNSGSRGEKKSQHSKHNNKRSRNNKKLSVDDSESISDSGSDSDSSGSSESEQEQEQEPNKKRQGRAQQQSSDHHGSFAKKCVKEELKKVEWTDEMVERLNTGFAENKIGRGARWDDVAECVGCGVTAEQCKNKWNNVESGTSDSDESGSDDDNNSTSSASSQNGNSNRSGQNTEKSNRLSPTEWSSDMIECLKKACKLHRTKYGTDFVKVARAVGHGKTPKQCKNWCNNHKFSLSKLQASKHSDRDGTSGNDNDSETNSNDSNSRGGEMATKAKRVDRLIAARKQNQNPSGTDWTKVAAAVGCGKSAKQCKQWFSNQRYHARKQSSTVGKNDDDGNSVDGSSANSSDDNESNSSGSDSDGGDSNHNENKNEATGAARKYSGTGFWTDEMFERLKAGRKKYRTAVGNRQHCDWEQVAKFVGGGVDTKQCQNKWKHATQRTSGHTVLKTKGRNYASQAVTHSSSESGSDDSNSDDDRYRGNNTPRRNEWDWTAESLHRLIRAKEKYRTIHSKGGEAYDWDKVAEYVGGGVTATRCQNTRINSPSNQKRLRGEEVRYTKRRSSRTCTVDNEHSDESQSGNEKRVSREGQVWSVDMAQRLMQAHNKARCNDWSEIAAAVGGGVTEKQCQYKWANERAKRRNQQSSTAKTDNSNKHYSKHQHNDDSSSDDDHSSAKAALAQATAATNKINWNAEMLKRLLYARETKACNDWTRIAKHVSSVAEGQKVTEEQCKQKYHKYTCEQRKQDYIDMIAGDSDEDNDSKHKHKKVKYSGDNQKNMNSGSNGNSNNNNNNKVHHVLPYKQSKPISVSSTSTGSASVKQPTSAATVNGNSRKRIIHSDDDSESETESKQSNVQQSKKIRTDANVNNENVANCGGISSSARNMNRSDSNNTRTVLSTMPSNVNNNNNSNRSNSSSDNVNSNKDKKATIDLTKSMRSQDSVSEASTAGGNSNSSRVSAVKPEVDDGWTKEQKTQLMELATKHTIIDTNGTRIDWPAIASILHRDTMECQVKHSLLLRATMKQGPFTTVEDNYILAAVQAKGEQYPGLWDLLEKELNRSSVQVLGRWRNVLKARVEAATIRAEAAVDV